ncbi:hypothetical protein [Pseudomonas nitroreducens]|uniref:hypothetical protein n=1 Tax=Pseudomonas nitroreducens TaxID=46680 RepID=UPI003CC832A0
MSFECGTLFDPFADDVRYSPIARMRELQLRARKLLKGRTITQLQDASNTIDWLIDEFFYKEKEKWIAHQIEHGGSIFRFLDYEYRTEAGLRDLIDHSFDSEITSELDFPKAENTKDLEALDSSLCELDLDDESFPGANPHEYVAVLALKQIASALNTFSDDDWPPALKGDAPMIQLRGIANDALDIMETVCHAESLQQALRLEEISNKLLLEQLNKVIPAKAEALAKTKMSLAARKAAHISHKGHREGRSAAQADWDENGAAYSSMAAFARHRHKEYGVTDRTLYGWIRDHRKART